MEKICFVSSSGGHWEELMCLKPVMEENYSFYVTEESEQLEHIARNKIYCFPQINRRDKYFIFHFVKLFFEARKILHKEQPTYIITTGALLAYPFCLVGKLMSMKIIYIESFARVNNKSLTGRLIYPIADLFLVQWESLLELYPKARYVGSIF